MLSGVESPSHHELLVSQAAPSICAMLSAIAFPLQFIYASSRTQVIPDQHPQLHNSRTIFAWKMLRLLACVALMATTSVTAIQAHTSIMIGRLEELDDPQWAEVYLCAFYAYTALLAALTIHSNIRIHAVATSHLVVLLLVSFSILAWDEFLPLAISTSLPVKSTSTWLTWIRLALLGFAAVIMPVCTPRLYVPLDPKNPNVPNPEQTTPLLSLVLYLFLDPLIWTAYRSGNPQYDYLPPLADYDRALHLRERSFNKLDSFSQTKHRHLFWGLMQVFWKEYCVMAVMVVIKSFIDFAGPLGIRALLKYIEDPSNSGPIRPWVWVSCLFLGPIIGSIAVEWYKFISCRLVTYTESMLTQLLFEHTLRIRVISENPPGTSRDNTKREDEKFARSSNLIGKINNLMSTDLKYITEGCDFLMLILNAPIQIVFSVVFLYTTLGWSATFGAVVMLFSAPVQVKLAQLISQIQVQRMKRTDARVQNITESMNLIRMIKMFAWENKVKKQVAEKREEELYWYRRQQRLSLFNVQFNFILPVVVMIATYSSHTWLMNNSLNASTVFSSITVFDVLRTQLKRLLTLTPQIINAKVSLDRTNDFLANTELLDAYTNNNPSIAAEVGSLDNTVIGFHNAAFVWKQQPTSLPKTSRRNFRLHLEGQLVFQHRKINMIIGPTGCGKSSLLMALLGEMHFVPVTKDSCFSLPRQGGIAYAAQEPWVQNKTIRQNILFGTHYDEERYNQVIFQCALEPDLELFEAGDQTEVGERGITLSGGQKARVSLARAIYSGAEIVILDDIFSSLDVHTSRWIADHCFRGGVMVERTVIMATHNVAMVGEVADFVVLLGPEGRITSQGNATEILGSTLERLSNTEKHGGVAYKGKQVTNDTKLLLEQEMNETKPNGKLMVPEEIALGHIGWPALKMFLLALGGLGFWLLYIIGFVLADLAVLLQTYWLGIWAQQYDGRGSETVNVTFYLAVYAIICVLGIAFFSSAFVVHVKGSVRASRRIHDQLVVSMLGVPLRWLDSTPVGRIIARFTEDIRSLDGTLPNTLRQLVDLTIQLVSRLVAIVVLSPIFVFPGIVLLAVGIWIGQIYITAQLWVKRETSNARAPVLSHFGAALNGITTIRAYGAEELFRKEASDCIDKYTRAARTFFNFNRWICIRMDALGAAFTGGLAAYLVYGQKSMADASNTGFSLNMAVAFSGGILWWVRNLNQFEVQGNSLERIQAYVEIEQEPAAVPEKAPPAYWPASGGISVRNLTARYFAEGPAVLHGLSFDIKSGERVGIVGRTGSGKSSLALSLLRMIPYEGTVCYDGVSTDAVNLDALRSSITIIPQHPELMSGTIRENLDPFEEHEDAELYAALRSAGLNIPQSEHAENHFELDMAVSAGENNFSLGQRQMLSLARALVRRSKVLIMDEATAAIDHKADAAIQTSIRTELNGTTLIIIAHRLQTICDADKIMVLKAGKIVEFDSPAALLSREGSEFKSLVDESGDRDALYAMAKSKQ